MCEYFEARSCPTGAPQAVAGALQVDQYQVLSRLPQQVMADLPSAKGY
jgi:hypothetical protein